MSGYIATAQSQEWKHPRIFITSRHTAIASLPADHPSVLAFNLLEKMVLEAA